MIPSEAFFKPYLVCNGCFDVVKRSQTVTCGKECIRYCMVCVRKSVEFARATRKQVLRCLSEDCDQFYDPRNLKAFLPLWLYSEIEHKVPVPLFYKNPVKSVKGVDLCDICEEPILVNPNSWYDAKCSNQHCRSNRSYEKVIIHVDPICATVGFIFISAVTHFCLRMWG